MTKDQVTDPKIYAQVSDELAQKCVGLSQEEAESLVLAQGDGRFTVDSHDITTCDYRLDRLTLYVDKKTGLVTKVHVG